MRVNALHNQCDAFLIYILLNYEKRGGKCLIRSFNSLNISFIEKRNII